MSFVCKICGQEFKSIGGLHGHLIKTEKVSQSEYYEKYFPKLDLFNGKPIPYKNYDDYKDRLFIDRKSEFAYLRKSNFDTVSESILSGQLEKILGKSSHRFPTYCEWRSSKNIRYDFLVGSDIFDKFIHLASGFKCLYNFSPKTKVEGELIKKNINILIDTREQKPLFEGPKTTINVGDYTASKEDYNGVHIDRKSKADFIGTFTSGLERFKKECEKAKSMGIKLVVLVEEPFSVCFAYRPLKFTKQVVTGENAFRGLRDVSRQFDNVQFLFVKDREESKKYINLLLNNKKLVTDYDLQFLYELGEI